MSKSTNVLKMTSSLTIATEAASEIASTAESIYETVSAVTQQSYDSLMKLTEKGASIDQLKPLSDFRDAMRDTNASGEDLMSTCRELRENWKSFEIKISEIFKSNKEISRTEVQECIQLLQFMLESAENCRKCYKEFREKLNRAIPIGKCLAPRFKDAAEDSMSEAWNTKAVGYGTAGVAALGAAALGAAALGFLTVATGGVAAVGAAAAGAAAAGTGAYTYDRAGKLEKLAGEFYDQRGKLDDALRDLKSLGDSITGLFTVTEKMAENMEIALKIVKEQERLKQENEEMELEKQKMKQEIERRKQENDEMKQQQEIMRQKYEELEKRLKELEFRNRKT